MAKYVLKVTDENGRQLTEAYLERRRTETTLVPGLLADGDFEPLRRLGHNWFGSGAAYGLPRISLLGQRLERAAERRDTAAAAAVVEDMAQFLDSVVVSPPT